MIVMPIAPTDNRIRYVTNVEGKTIDVILPVELWQQIINSINIDIAIDNVSGLALVDEQEPKEQILADLQESIRLATIGQTIPVSQLWEDNLEFFAMQNLEQCYGEDEPEYSLELIKEHNSNYARK
jgi:hypothetical protein